MLARYWDIRLLCALLCPMLHGRMLSDIFPYSMIAINRECWGRKPWSSQGQRPCGTEQNPATPLPSVSVYFFIPPSIRSIFDNFSVVTTCSCITAGALEQHAANDGLQEQCFRLTVEKENTAVLDRSSIIENLQIIHYQRIDTESDNPAVWWKRENISLSNASSIRTDRHALHRNRFGCWTGKTSGAPPW